MYSASFCCASCFGNDTSTSVFCFFDESVAQSDRSPEMKEPNPQSALAATFDLLDPAVGCISPGQSAPETFDVEVDWFAQGA